MMRAIIDIGTNTAHLLVARKVGHGHIDILTKKRHYTFLGEGGLEIIGNPAINRLKVALKDFESIIHQYNAKVHVIATEGLRSASNRGTITDIFTEVFGWSYSIISGDQEAKYIYQGTQLSLEGENQSILVMDIGGGSVEYIMTSENEIIYEKSHPIGISRLYEQYHRADPIRPMDIDEMYDALDEELEELWSMIETTTERPILVGCAGTFEVLLDQEDFTNKAVKSVHVNVNILLGLLGQVIHKSIEEREIVKDLPKERANYIVVALLLMNYMVKKLGCASLIVSKYALKEGAIMDDTLFLAAI